MNLLANFSSPVAVQRKIGRQFQAKRLAQNLTQAALSEKSGVSLGTLRRFEQEGEISLKHLVLLAMSLNLAQELEGLFRPEPVKDLFVKPPKIRRRAR
jgi:hypothetical protein